MPPDRLVALRAQEALSAARVLGLTNRTFASWAFPDSRLSEHEAKAIERVEELLKAHRPEQVFIPYRADHTADHVATNRIVSAALGAAVASRYGLRVPGLVLASLAVGSRDAEPYGPAGAARQRLGSLWLALAGGFRHYVPIAEVLERKRAALDQHASQMRRLMPDPRWKILPEVAGGDFLQCFFQPREVFRVWDLEARRAA